MKPADATPAPAAGTPTTELCKCGHRRLDHDDNRKHCCWYDDGEDISDPVTFCGCSEFAPAETPPAAEPPMSAPDASPTLGELCGDCHQPIRGTPLFRTVPDGTPYHVACAPYPLVPHGDPAPCECNSCCAHRIYGVAMTCCPRGLSHGANCICGVKSGGAAERAVGDTTEMDYEAAARSIALNLDEFCDPELSYPDMIADAARKAGALVRRVEARLTSALYDDSAEHYNAIRDVLGDIRATLAGGGQ